MIYDTLKNTGLYESLYPGFQKAFGFLKNYRPMPDGRYAIDGDDVYAIVDNHFLPRHTTDVRLEAHRNFIDIQCVMHGREWIYTSGLDTLTEETPYDAAADIAFYRGTDSTRLLMEDGSFAIFFPRDGHMGGIAVDKAAEETRVVVKVRVH